MDVHCTAVPRVNRAPLLMHYEYGLVQMKKASNKASFSRFLLFCLPFRWSMIYLACTPSQTGTRCCKLTDERNMSIRLQSLHCRCWNLSKYSSSLLEIGNCFSHTLSSSSTIITGNGESYTVVAPCGIGHCLYLIWTSANCQIAFSPAPMPMRHDQCALHCAVYCQNLLRASMSILK